MPELRKVFLHSIIYIWAIISLWGPDPVWISFPILEILKRPKEKDGAALVYISTLFVRNIVDIDFDDIAEAGPAVLAMIAMPFTYSISHGIAIAFIAYALIKLCTGKLNVSPAIWVIAILSVISFWVG